MKTIITVLLALLTCGPALRADDLILADGRYLQVKVLSATQDGIRVQRLDTGGEITIPWELIREADRERLRQDFGLVEDVEEAPTEEGVRLTAKSGDVYLGVAESEIPENQIPDPLIIWHGGRKLEFKADMVRSVEVAMVPSLEAFSPDQLYERYLTRFPPAPDDLEGHWDLARYCVSIGLYGKAVVHYLKVRELDSEYRSEYVANQISLMEVKARNQRVLDELRAAMRKAFYHQYGDALSSIEQLLSITELDPQIRLEIEQKKTRVIKNRWDYYSDLVASGYHRYLDIEIRKLAMDKELKLSAARRELQRNVHQRIVAALAQRYGLDPKNEVEKMWEERKVHGFRTASYVSGTLIILGKAPGAEELNQRVEASIRQALGDARGRGRGNDKNGSLGPVLEKLPKPPSPDDWWEKVSTGAARIQWMKAYFAENSGKMELGPPRYRSCPSCGGSGVRKQSGAQGAVLTIACPRCAGHKRDKVVVYK